MQTAQITTMNGTSRPLKCSSLSPQSADLAHTLNRINTPVYDITPRPEDKCKLEEEEEEDEVNYTTTQYYTTVDPQSSTSSSPIHMHAISPSSSFTAGHRNKCKLDPSEEIAYTTTQYYTTVDPQSSESSPVQMDSFMSPKESAGSSSTPGSVSSSKGSTSSENTGELHQAHRLHTPESGGTGEGHHSLCVQGGGGSLSEMSSGGGGGSVKHWTYEDQFKQLYNLSPEPERKEFLDKLFNFMQKKGTPITRVPIMAKQPLDLYKLFMLVVERGGLVEVIKKKAWRNVAKELNLPASITSAAFTMRSQYVKYLYPYECEMVKLSDPQELQMAIDSNKRDRRHSETVEFISPQLRELDQAGMIPVSHSVSTPQGLQLISSPTVTIPHGSMPHYTGGFIIAPGGTMVASPQFVQMPHVPGIPIVMPTAHAPQPAARQSRSRSTPDGEAEEQSLLHQESLVNGTEPPAAKRMAFESNAIKVTMNNRIPIPGNSFIMTAGGTPIVQPQGVNQLISSQALTPQLMQMPSPKHHITMTTAQQQQLHQQQQVTTLFDRSKMSVEGNIMRKTTPVAENSPVPVAAIPPHSASGGSNVVLARRGSPLLPSQHMLTSSGGVVQMTSQHLPLIIPSAAAMAVSGGGGGGSAAGTMMMEGGGGRLLQQEDGHRTQLEALKIQQPHERPSSSKMPFTNISIQSTGSKDGDHDGAPDASLLVTLELNNLVYQGVLFAKPSPAHSGSPSR